MRRFILGASALALAACATSGPVPTEPETLSEAEYQAVLKDATGAWGSKEFEEMEANHAAILARDDISTEQRAQTYLNRGIARSSVSPYCAVRDWVRGLELNPDHPSRDYILSEIEAEKQREGNFLGPEDIEDCEFVGPNPDAGFDGR
ncbi:hypothetical protein [Henriciella sp.]|uniref:hypothetical protein n=1 Tax=Henriciella sp. TaxID=1968823 RepID=UPI00261B1FAB|nr:hypothetical protein [Henriciella sp.]